MSGELEAIFGKTLKDLRGAKGISQESLAYESDLDRTYISLLERGERQPTLSTLFKIAKALKIQPSQIIKDLESRYENR